MPTDNAWVTLATNNTYSLGALVLAYSLKKVNTSYDLVVMITPGVTEPMRKLLHEVFNEVQEVNILDSKDESNLRLLQRPELGITFTKLHCWKLTQYKKCVFLDADTLVLKNCDELFEREELSAAPDVGWPDCFNSGVFVYKPSEETYNKLINFSLTFGSFDGGDQGLLNMFFNDWATADIRKHLPFIYNMCSAAIYSYIPAYKWFSKDVKIIHFISGAKPWLQSFNPFTRSVDVPDDLPHLKELLQLWWDLFCANVHPSLSTEMTEYNLRSWYDSENIIAEFPSISSILYQCMYAQEPEEHYTFTDPWEQYSQLDEENSKLDFYNTRVDNIDFNPVLQYPNKIDFHIIRENTQPFTQNHNLTGNSLYTNYKNCTIRNTNTTMLHANCKDSMLLNITVSSNPDPCPSSNHNYTSFPGPTRLEEFSIKKSENDDFIYLNDDGGLASSFAQMKLDESSVEVQKAIEDNLRRQNWEQGNIDYMGKDSFDNILAKINKTIGSPEQNSEEVKESIADLSFTPISAETKSEIDAPSVLKTSTSEHKSDVCIPQDESKQTYAEPIVTGQDVNKSVVQETSSTDVVCKSQSKALLPVSVAGSQLSPTPLTPMTIQSQPSPGSPTLTSTVPLSPESKVTSTPQLPPDSPVKSTQILPDSQCTQPQSKPNIQKMSCDSPSVSQSLSTNVPESSLPQSASIIPDSQLGLCKSEPSSSSEGCTTPVIPKSAGMPMISQTSITKDKSKQESTPTVTPTVTKAIPTEQPAPVPEPISTQGDTTQTKEQPSQQKQQQKSKQTQKSSTAGGKK